MKKRPKIGDLWVVKKTEEYHLGYHFKTPCLVVDLMFNVEEQVEEIKIFLLKRKEFVVWDLVDFMGSFKKVA